jgi:hypothetical protein
MAVLVPDTKFGLHYAESLAEDNDLLRDRLDVSLESFSSAYEELQRVKNELAQEKQRRKMAENKLKEMEVQRVSK